MFKCRKCGKCCTRFEIFPENNEWRLKLDSGDGTCKYLDRKTMLCTIYESRPPICNNVWVYENVFKDSMTREEFDTLRQRSCDALNNDEAREDFMKPENVKTFLKLCETPRVFENLVQHFMTREQFDEVLKLYGVMNT